MTKISFWNSAKQIWKSPSYYLLIWRYGSWIFYFPASLNNKKNNKTHLWSPLAKAPNLIHQVYFSVFLPYEFSMFLTEHIMLRMTHVSALSVFFLTRTIWLDAKFSCIYRSYFSYIHVRVAFFLFKIPCAILVFSLEKIGGEFCWLLKLISSGLL